MIRFIGLSSLVVASFLWGYQKAETLKKEILLSEELSLFLQTIRREGFLYRTPWPQVLASFQGKLFEEEGITVSIAKDGPAKAFSCYRVLFGLDELLYSRLLRFFTSFGTMSLSEGIVACEDMIALLEKALDDKKERYPRLRKLYVTLGLSLGLMTVILLL